MGGRGGTGGSKGSGPVSTVRAAYNKLARNLPDGFVAVADLRDAVPHLGRTEFDNAVKTLARENRANQLFPWDNWKALTDREKSGGVDFGGSLANNGRLATHLRLSRRGEK